MLRLLIADDEKKVGKLVKELIAWDKLEIELLDIVQDGKTALDMIVEKRPDIVITDIRMPNMTGLELIKTVAESGLDVHFIVISGFRYFEYAQQALKYGVVDYLLKPIDEAELNSILEKVCGQEKNKRKHTELINSMENKIRNSKYVLHRELIERIIREKEKEPHLISEWNRDYGVNFENGVFRVLAIKADRDVGITRNEKQERLIYQKLEELVEHKFADIVNDIVQSVQEGKYLIVLLNYREERRETVNKQLTLLFSQIMDYMNDFEYYAVTMGVSGETDDFSEINLIIEVAKEELNCRILVGTQKRIENCAVKRSTALFAEDIIRKYQPDLENAIEILNREQVQKIVRTCFLEAEHARILACEYYELARITAECFCGKISTQFGDDLTETYQTWDELFNNCISLEMLKSHLCLVLGDYIYHMLEKRKETERKPIQETIEYIRKNFGKKILLEELADKCGFNAAYFSEMFKNETGKNFSVYLLEVRMEAAKELLRDSNDTVYEIADKVGYKDSKYFSQQFTRVVGIKPVEYRKLYY